jgi:hypothetical protein
LDELDFLSISNLIFADYTGSKNQGVVQKLRLQEEGVGSQKFRLFVNHKVENREFYESAFVCRCALAF